MVTKKAKVIKEEEKCWGFCRKYFEKQKNIKKNWLVLKKICDDNFQNVIARLQKLTAHAPKASIR